MSSNVTLTLDCGDPIDLNPDQIESTEPTTAPDGHSYVRIVYQSEERGKQFYALKDCRQTKKFCQQIGR